MLLRRTNSPEVYLLQHTGTTSNTKKTKRKKVQQRLRICHGDTKKEIMYLAHVPLACRSAVSAGKVQDLDSHPRLGTETTILDINESSRFLHRMSRSSVLKVNK